MTVKKISKILTFILVLAMVLGTVAMADGVEYTITAGTFTNGTLTLKIGDNHNPLTSGSTVKAAENTKVIVETKPDSGYETVKIICKTGDKETELADGGTFTVTGDTTVTPVFREKQSLGGEKPVDSFRLDAICNGYSNWQAYHKDTANNKKYTK